MSQSRENYPIQLASEFNASKINPVAQNEDDDSRQDERDPPVINVTIPPEDDDVHEEEPAQEFDQEAFKSLLERNRQKILQLANLTTPKTADDIRSLVDEAGETMRRELTGFFSGVVELNPAQEQAINVLVGGVLAEAHIIIDRLAAKKKKKKKKEAPPPSPPTEMSPREKEVKRLTRVITATRAALAQSPSGSMFEIQQDVAQSFHDRLSEYFRYAQQLIRDPQNEQEAQALHRLDELIQRVVEAELQEVRQWLESNNQVFVNIVSLLSRFGGVQTLTGVASCDHLINNQINPLIAQATAQLAVGFPNSPIPENLLKEVAQRDYVEPLVELRKQIEERKKALEDEAKEKAKQALINTALTEVEAMRPGDRSRHGATAQEQLTNLSTLRGRVETHLRTTRGAGLLTNDSGNTETQRLIGQYEALVTEVLGEIDTLIKTIEDLPVEEMTKEELIQWAMDNIHLIFDDSQWTGSSNVNERRMREKVKELIAEKENETLAEKHERCRLHVRLALHAGYDRYVVVAHAAFAGRHKVRGSTILDWWTGPVKMSREIAILGGFENRRDGESVRKMWDDVKTSAAIPKGFAVVERRVVMREGEQENLPTSDPLEAQDIDFGVMRVLINSKDLLRSERAVFEYQKELDYQVLAESGGIKSIKKYLKRKYPRAEDESIDLVAMIFTTTDQLSEAGAHLQTQTKTMAHKPNSPFNLQVLFNPVGGAEHGGERYSKQTGGREAWFLSQLPSIPITDTLGRQLSEQDMNLACQDLFKFYRIPTNKQASQLVVWKARWIETMKKAEKDGFFYSKFNDKEKRYYPSQYLREIQRWVKDYYKCFFYYDDIESLLKPQQFGESLFPNYSSIFGVLETEFLHDGDRVINGDDEEYDFITQQWKNRNTGTSRRQNRVDVPNRVWSIEGYQTAGTGTPDEASVAEKSIGWAGVLEMFFRSVMPKDSEDGLTHEGIVGDSGLLVKWISEWGKIKIWPGYQMKMFASLTAEYCLRLASAFEHAGSPKEMRELWQAMVVVLSRSSDDTAGLAVYKEGVQQVIKILGEKSPNPSFGDYTMNRDTMLARERCLKTEQLMSVKMVVPPITIRLPLGFRKVMKSPFAVLGDSDKLVEDYYAVIRGEKAPNPPAIRQARVK